MHCGCEATKTSAYSKIYNGKSRHIALRHEYVRQLISDGIITVVYIKFGNNLANPLTKGLSRDMIKNTIRAMGLRPF